MASCSICPSATGLFQLAWCPPDLCCCNWQDFILSEDWIIFHFRNMPLFLYPLICRWTSGLFLPFVAWFVYRWESVFQSDLILLWVPLRGCSFGTSKQSSQSLNLTIVPGRLFLDRPFQILSIKLQAPLIFAHILLLAFHEALSKLFTTLF